MRVLVVYNAVASDVVAAIVIGFGLVAAYVVVAMGGAVVADVFATAVLSAT